MSVKYASVGWNSFKRRYDFVAIAAVLIFLCAFVVFGRLLHNSDNAISIEILVVRALAICAFTLLNLILCIGPLSRLDRRFLPLLHNRRHLGVLTFLLGLLHAILAFGFYHGFGAISPAVSLLTSNVQYRSLSAFPFEILGLLALLILFLMAATSHDFWLKNLGMRAWKWLHMGVYLAWGLLVLHVALGALQSEGDWVYVAALAAVVVFVPALHLIAGAREGSGVPRSRDEVWFDAANVSEIPENRGKTVRLPHGERVAIFRHQNRFSAVSNVCAHQGGPLGEGRIIDGCITCPWHGYQYRPEDGCAPPPFTEKLATFRVRIVGDRVQVNSTPLPSGTAVEPALIDAGSADSGGSPASDEFFVGYLPVPPRARRWLVRVSTMLLVASCCIATALALMQRDPGPAVWTTEPSIFQGRITEFPYPVLRTEVDGRVTQTSLLVSEGKLGAAQRVKGLNQRFVRIKGTTLSRPQEPMIEIADAPDAVEEIPNTRVAIDDSPTEVARNVTLAGEIVDPKCFLGAMKPGNGKTHKACATLCLRGGIPPMFVTTLDGKLASYLLTDVSGGPLTGAALEAVLPFVADPVTLRGDVITIEGVQYLRVDPASISRR